MKFALCSEIQGDETEGELPGLVIEKKLSEMLNQCSTGVFVCVICDLIALN